MLVFLFAIVCLVSWYIALDELKRASPRDFELLGGDKIYFWPPSQSSAAAYFLIIGYKSNWQKIEKHKWSFILTTVSGWLGLIWACFYFYDLLK